MTEGSRLTARCQHLQWDHRNPLPPFQLVAAAPHLRKARANRELAYFSSEVAKPTLPSLLFPSFIPLPLFTSQSSHLSLVCRLSTATHRQPYKPYYCLVFGLSSLGAGDLQSRCFIQSSPFRLPSPRRHSSASRLEFRLFQYPPRPGCKQFALLAKRHGRRD